LFNGLIVLPVLLSIFGPSSPYLEADSTNEDEVQVDEMNHPLSNHALKENGASPRHNVEKTNDLTNDKISVL